MSYVCQGAFIVIFQVNFKTYFFLRDKLPISMKMLEFFGKMSLERRKNHGCGQKKPKSTSSATFALKTAAKSCENSSRVPTEFEQNRRGKFELFA